MKKIVLCVSFILIFLLCGCGREIDDVAYVVAIGVDKADDSYEFTFAIGNPDSINGDDEDVLVFESAVSKDLFAAGDSVSSRIGQDVNFSHAELMVFSETVATEGVGRFLDSLTRNLNQRPKLIPAVAEGSAKDKLTHINSKFEGNPEKYLKKVFESRSSPVAMGVDIRGFLCRTKNSGVATALPMLNSEEDVSSTSMAVFHGEYLVGTLDDLLAYKLLSGAGESINYDGGESGSVHLAQRVPPKVYVDCGNTPEIDIIVNLDASVNTILSDITADELYLEVEEKLEDRFISFLNQTASVSADVLGFERYARRCFLTWVKWDAYDWFNRYGKAKFDVTVNLIPEKTGLAKGES